MRNLTEMFEQDNFFLDKSIEKMKNRAKNIKDAEELVGVWLYG